MKINKKHILTFFLLIFFFLGILTIFSGRALAETNTVQPSNLWNQQTGVGEMGQAFGESNPNGVTDIRITIVRIVNIVLTFLGIIFLVLIVFSGYQWMTSGGNEESVKKAQGRMTSAIIGLVIILLAWSISTFVIKRAICATIPEGSYSYQYCGPL